MAGPELQVVGQVLRGAQRAKRVARHRVHRAARRSRRARARSGRPTSPTKMKSPREHPDRPLARRAIGDDEADVLGRVARRVPHVDADASELDRVAVAQQARAVDARESRTANRGRPRPESSSCAPVLAASSRAPDTKSAWMCVSVTYAIVSLSRAAASMYRSTSRFGSTMIATCASWSGEEDNSPARAGRCRSVREASRRMIARIARNVREGRSFAALGMTVSRGPLDALRLPAYGNGVRRPLVVPFPTEGVSLCESSPAR